MSVRVLEFYTCNLCGVEKQGPQSWHRYGVVDINSAVKRSNFYTQEYCFDIHVCHECFSENVPTMRKKIIDFMFKFLRFK